MRVIHGEKFKRHEQERFRRPIIENVMQSVFCLVDAMKSFNMTFKKSENNENYESLLRAKEYLLVDMADWNKNKENYGMNIKTIWADETIRLCYDRRNQYYLNDSTE
jgi:hypothetical protein